MKTPLFITINYYLEMAISIKNCIMLYFSTSVILDFMSLELKNGFLHLFVNYGSGTSQVNLTSTEITLDRSHTIRIVLTPSVMFNILTRK